MDPRSDEEELSVLVNENEINLCELTELNSFNEFGDVNESPIQVDIPYFEPVPVRKDLLRFWLSSTNTCT